MEFVTARELRLDPKGVWRRLESQTMGVVTVMGKPCFLLTKIEAKDLELILYIQNRIRAELALEKMRERVHQKGLDRLTQEEINEIIRKTRKSRKK